jgi:polyphenol oxidase
MRADWLLPQWRAEGVGAVMTTRAGGISRAPFDSMNIRFEVGDDEAAVAHNRALLAEATGAVPVYLNQLHGAVVVRLDARDAQPGAPVHTADACVSTAPGIACTAQVADCLPVLFAAPEGRAVAAAHAGWRGLSLGVLEATVRQLCAAASCEPAGVQVWLGACIGPARFEVGADVLRAFGADPQGSDPARFVPGKPGKWLANLPQLARDRLRAAGVQAVSGGEWCTVDEPSRFFSYRRDGVTGRMVAAVWRLPEAGQSRRP